MAKIGGKKKLPISNSDLKKAIVERNKSLSEKNKVLSNNIKDKEKELKSLEKDHTSKCKEYSRLTEEIAFQQERDSKVRGGIYSNEKLLAEKLKLVSRAEKKYKSYEDESEKLKGKKKDLLEEISSLEFYKSRCEESKNDLAGIQAKKDNALDELEAVNNEIDSMVKESNEKISYYEDRYDDLEEQAKKHEDMVYQFEQRLVDTQNLFKDEQKKLDIFRVQSEKEIKKSQDELQAIKNLCNDTEDKYIKWEIKIKKISEKADKEQDKIKKAKDNFAKWKIGVLEEVARLKLKNKVDNIDKAGLSDILNG